MNGKPGVAPCGHQGEHVIGTYVQCKRCDTRKTPKIASAQYLCPKGHRCEPVLLVDKYFCWTCGFAFNREEITKVNVSP